MITRRDALKLIGVSALLPGAAVKECEGKWGKAELLVVESVRGNEGYDGENVIDFDLAEVIARDLRNSMECLDWWAKTWGLTRRSGESDASLRMRIIDHMYSPRPPLGPLFDSGHWRKD